MVVEKEKGDLHCIAYLNLVAPLLRPRFIKHPKETEREQPGQQQEHEIQFIYSHQPNTALLRTGTNCCFWVNSRFPGQIGGSQPFLILHSEHGNFFWHKARVEAALLY